MKTFWSYLTAEAAYRAQLAQVSQCPRAGGSEKTSDDLGASAMFIGCHHSGTSRMAAVGSNGSAVFRGEIKAEAADLCSI